MLSRLTISALAIATLFGLGLSLPDPAQAQSYNCRYAKKAAEVLICQNRQLANLDEELAEVYADARARLGQQGRARLQREQNAWRVRRDACGRNVGCIDGSYRQRLRQLYNIAY